MEQFSAFVWVVRRDGRDDPMVELWREHKAESKVRFAGFEMELENRSDKSPTPTVKTLDLPFKRQRE